MNRHSTDFEAVRRGKQTLNVKIQIIPISPPAADAAEADAEFAKLKVSGPIDPDDAVMRRAREFVQRTGSRAMIESFDWAVEHSNFITEE